MEHAAPKGVTSEHVPAGRLLWVGTLAALLSAGANALVLATASSRFGPVVVPPDEVMTIGRVAVASAAGAVGAAVVLAAVVRFARRPVLVFRSIAAVGLLLSFIPIIAAGAQGSSAGTLALMHAVAAAISVGLLTTGSGRKR